MSPEAEAIRATLRRYKQDEKLYLAVSALVASTTRYVAAEFKQSIVNALRTNELGLLAVLDNPDKIISDLTS